jgi:homoserine dehydrogenase
VDKPGTAATIAKRLAQQNISIESIVQRHRDASPHGGDIPGRSGVPVPVILITYATTEDAVRKALAAVDRDKVISGTPQVIRIEKN